MVGSRSLKVLDIADLKQKKGEANTSRPQDPCSPYSICSIHIECCDTVNYSSPGEEVMQQREDLSTPTVQCQHPILICPKLSCLRIAHALPCSDDSSVSLMIHGHTERRNGSGLHYLSATLTHTPSVQDVMIGCPNLQRLHYSGFKFEEADE